MTAKAYIFAAYIIIMVGGRLISQRQRRTGQRQLFGVRAAVRDRTALLAAFFTAASIALPVIEATQKKDPLFNATALLIGAAFICAGWGAAYFANGEIGENWSPAVEKTEKQKLVVSGAYSIVRHPLYASGLLIIVGSNIYFMSTWAWGGLILCLSAILIRLPVEERLLEERFGQDYIAYKKRTKAIVPWFL